MLQRILKLTHLDNISLKIVEMISTKTVSLRLEYGDYNQERKIWSYFHMIHKKKEFIIFSLSLDVNFFV